ncbi:MAG TPA: 2Fe-2S iron-sulfur cluster-binding protein [Actinomycetota bacterium]|nr:2Fe-2S iron-sulfur cluster-binding protein [Actinomycetota bacterium]
MSGRRLDAGGRIDRSRPIRFTFDGRGYDGFEGDTLASALLANGVDVVCRSPILGRPRGVVSAGVEEPSAFVEVAEPWFEPVVAAPMVNLIDGLVASGRPGVGRLPAQTHRTKPSVTRNRHVETLVIGSGGKGLEVARTAAARGERVLLVEREPYLAGSGLGRGPEGVEVLVDATALGVYDDGYVVVLHRGPEHDTVWHIRAARVVLATGAFERPIAFADNDRPGVMLNAAVGRYIRDFGVLPGARIVAFGANVTVLETHDLRRAGAEIVATADVREGWAVAGTEGETRVEAVHLVGPGGERRTVEADLVAVAGGWNPALQLYRAIGGGLRYDDDLATFVPDGSGPPWLEVVGAAAGDLPPSVAYWYTPAEDLSRHFVDLQRDQTVADVLAAVDGGLRSVEHVKRATYIGTAIDQGRTSGTMTAEIVNVALGWELGAQGPTNARPPFVPVSFAALAGLDRGPELLDPVRRSPMHAAHVERGAVFEDVGQWKRPRYFPHGDEDMQAAVARECLAVRDGAGVLDASTLGKIEVVGPDAPAFLDRMYTNRMSNLAVGSIRYGLMLGLDGMVFDDGVAMRLAEDRYLVTTTTGGAAAVLDRFEEWLQTEWPELRVYCTSVTEQWAVIAVGGPKARAVLADVGTDLDLLNDAFPFMTFRDGVVAGVAARVCRVSFTGELSYEIHVPSWDGPHVWEAVFAAGEMFGVEPYGTEAMHVLRAEKGFVIVGQDTDGTATPDDLGMGWIVNPSKGDFLGKRSLVRPDSVRSGRKQLVGIVPHDPDLLLPEGTQLIRSSTIGAPPVPMLGHVTSSYRSAALGWTFALAMVEGGRELRGRTIHAALAGGTAPVDVTDPVFYDAEGARRDG